MEHQVNPQVVGTGFALSATTKPATGLMTPGANVTYLRAPIPVPMAPKNTTVTRILSPAGWLMGRQRGGVLLPKLNVAWSWR